MTMTELDNRLHAIDANHDTAVKMEIIAPVAAVHREPGETAMQITQALFGEKVTVFEIENGWARCQLENDGYVGFITATALGESITSPTHRVSTASTHMFPKPDMKSQPAVSLPMNADVEVISGDGKFAGLSNGKFIFANHLVPLASVEPDYVAVAEKFIGTPYYWGGKSILGLDCSGLVQTSLRACGISALRDTDMQEKQLGKNLLINDLDGLRRGDLIFWKGHVGIMVDDKILLHANSHHMLTVNEPLAEAIERIASKGYPITSIKRF